MSLRGIHKRLFAYAQKILTVTLISFLVFSDIDHTLQWPPQVPSLPTAEAADQQAVLVESFDQNVTTDGSTFTLANDVGATSSAFVRMNTGTRKTSAGPTGSTANTAPNIGTVGLRLTSTDTITVERADPTEVKVMGEVWRYEGPSGGAHEFIVRDRVEVTLSGSLVTQSVSGVTNVDNVVPFVTGYTVNGTSVGDWNAATIGAHMNDAGDLVVSRNNSGPAATVYVDVVEFTGSAWSVCHGYSSGHDTAEQTITLNTDSDGQGGSTCDVGDWGTASIIEATMEGDSGAAGLSDTLALVRPGGTTDSVVFDVQQDASAQNDGEAWIHVLQNNDMAVYRASSGDINEGDGSYDIVAWPAGASTTSSLDTLSLEWFSDTSGTGPAHMRGGLHARIQEASPTTYADNDLVPDTDYDSTVEANFEADITFAASPEGVVYEAGGTGTGSFVGYNDAGDFIIRAGNGGSTAPSDAARIIVTPTDYDFSSRSGELAWTFDPVNESVSLSFDEGSDGSVDYSTSTTATAAWPNWSGGDDGGVGTSNGSLAGSEITSAFNFNGTITEVRFTQGGSFDYEIEHWIHRMGNTVGVEYGVIDLQALTFDPVFLSFDTLVTATGTHITTAEIPASNVYVGGAFSIREKTTSRNVTNITLSESGTVDGANGLADIELWYDVSTTSPYDCSEHSYDGDETQFGSADGNGFSGADGSSSFTDAVQISPTRSLCVYPVVSTTESASDGETIALAIDDATSDVMVTGGGAVGSASYPQAIGGSVTLQSAELTQTHYRWLNDDGAEGVATAIEAEDTPALGFANGTTRRLRLQVSAEGSTSSLPVSLRLEYASNPGTCSAATGWTDVGAVGGDWDMSPSSFITDGANSSDLAVASGGTTNENLTHLTPNGALRDTTSSLGALTFTSTNFLEAEFAVEPTAGAPDGTTYCFRLSDGGTALPNYDVFPEATISADITVSATGAHASNVDAGTNDFHLGGAFALERSGSERTLTDVTLSETGSINASSSLSNVRLVYDLDTSAPYDCSSESYAGTEPQFGVTDIDGFSGPNGTSTFNGSLAASSTQSICFYVVADVAEDAGDGDTIQVQITDPSSDVVVTGSTVGPGTAVAPAGSVSVASAVLTQVHYHWRNDDGNETDATSATGGIEDTPLTAVPLESTRRVRIAVSNEGTVTSPATTYRLEYGTKVSTCSNIVSWTSVGSLDAAWDMSLSPNIADGNTTDIATSTDGAVTNENTTFVGTGALRETTAESGPITLTDTDFTELEYSIAATENAGFDTDYCFRVTDAGTPLPTYSVYPELTTREKQDFFVQRGSTNVTGTGVTLTAGVDYTAPAGTSTAFVRITNSQLTGAGDSSGTAPTDSNDATAYISDQSDLTSDFTIGRAFGAVGDTRVDWEIVEFVGQPGTDNELVVRDVGTLSVLTATTAGPAVANIADDADVAVFITGQGNDSASRVNYNDGSFTADWDAVNNRPTFERGDADSSVDVSYAVVEFVGQNWRVQRVEHTYTAAGVAETESMSVIPGVNRAFVHAQKRTGNNLNGLDEFGHQVWISSIGAVSFQLRAGADTPSDHTSVAWVIANTQTGEGAMNVIQSAGTIPADGPFATAVSLSIGQTVNTENASIFATNDSDGTGTFFPRTIAAFTIASSTNYELWRSETGQPIDFRVEVVEWPVADVGIRQNYYRFYVDNDALDPSDPWPAGPSNLGENTSITANDEPLGEGEVVRLRMTLQISNATLPSNISAFKLQYGLQTTSCGAVSTWNDLGDPGSGAIWRGRDGSIADGTPVAASSPGAGALNISVSDVAGTYEEANDSAINPYAVDIGEDVEYDWVIEHNGAAQRSDYCFRMINADGTELDGYNNYPVVRTTGYTPVVADWRWFDDETSLTPATPLAAENVAPIDIANEEVLKLRVLVSEVENAAGSNVKFALQYSQSPDFTSGGTTLIATSTCTSGDLWCYADGTGIDNDPIDTAVLTNADACAGGVGNGCGTHNEAATTTSTLTQPASSNMEFEFTLRNAAARASGVYYFRLYDVNADEPLIASSSYPSLVTEGPQLVFSVSGVDAETSIAGITTDATSTATSIDFGSVPFNTDVEVAQRLSVDTNATQGYQVFKYADQQLMNVYGTEIEPVLGTNAAPLGWSSACLPGAESCFGYHTTDATLAGGSGRFSAIDSYAALSTDLAEVMHSSVPAVDEHDIVYRIRVSEQQPAGDYSTNLTYITVPVF